jgi:hypothetical protein
MTENFDQELLRLNAAHALETLDRAHWSGVSDTIGFLWEVLQGLQHPDIPAERKAQTASEQLLTLTEALESSLMQSGQKFEEADDMTENEKFLLLQRIRPEAKPDEYIADWDEMPPLEGLNKLIDDGIEFPEAFRKVVVLHQMTVEQADELKASYDDQ